MAKKRKKKQTKQADQAKEVQPVKETRADKQPHRKGATDTSPKRRPAPPEAPPVSPPPDERPPEPVLPPAWICRTSGLVIALSLGVWIGCLMMLWNWLLDTSGASAVETLAVGCLAIAAGMALSPQVLRAGRWALHKPTDDHTSCTRDGRMPGVAVMFTVVCGLVSTLAVVFLALGPAEWLTRRMMWTRESWWLMRLVLRWVGMLPMGLAIGVTFPISARLRAVSDEGGRQSACREWLAGAAMAAAVVAMLWWTGADILSAGVVVSCVLAVTGTVLLVGRARLVAPHAVVAPGGSAPGASQRVLTAATFAILAFALAGQVRLLGDLGGLGGGAKTAWLAGSAAVLAMFLVRRSRRAVPLTDSETAAAATGAVVTLLMQGAIAASLVAGRDQDTQWAAVAAIVLAGAMQVPFLALLATVLSRNTDRLVDASGWPVTLGVWATLGSGVGVAVFLAAMRCGQSRLALAVLGAVGVIAYVARGALLSAGRRARLEWITYGLVLILAGVVALVGVSKSVSSVTAGAWLSLARDGSGRRQTGLVWADGWRSRPVSRAVGDVLRRREHQGRWWIVSPSAPNLPDGLPRGVWISASSPDVTCATGAWRDQLRGEDADFLSATQISRQWFAGMLLSPLPADHPQAWRCYNRPAIRRARQRLQKGGAMLLRTQVRRDSVIRALLVARMFESVVRSGWVVLCAGESEVDILLAGPAEAVRRPTVDAGARVDDLRKLVDRVRTHPRGRMGRLAVSRSDDNGAAAELLRWLDSAAQGQ